MNQMQRAYNTILRLLGFYDSHGLKYSIEHLKSIRNDIPFWHRKRQAKYVDLGTRRNVEDIPEQLGIDLLKENKKTWFIGKEVNATGVGNLAYVSLNHPEYYIRAYADDMLINYRNYLSKAFNV